MKDILKDLISHTYSLGFIDLIKIKGSDKSVAIDTGLNNNVLISGETKNAVPEFKDVTIGFPNIGKLELHLKNPEYKEGEKIELVWDNREGEKRPVAIHFENATGDYKNFYGLMSGKLASEKIKDSKFKGAAWHVEVEPSITSIQRMKLQQAAHTEEDTFRVSTENGDLKFYFGDPSTHEGSFIFHKGVTGKLKNTSIYPVSQFVSILGLDGDKTMKFSDDGICLITVDSGLAVYNYYLPSLTK